MFRHIENAPRSYRSAPGNRCLSLARCLFVSLFLPDLTVDVFENRLVPLRKVSRFEIYVHSQRVTHFQVSPVGHNVLAQSALSQTRLTGAVGVTGPETTDLRHGLRPTIHSTVCEERTARCPSAPSRRRLREEQPGQLIWSRSTR